jgi:hypothetical protein
MRVVVVAKTRVGGAVCVGALDAQNASLRLYEPNWSFPPANTPYQVGQVWEMTLVPRPSPTPPHVEDVAVTSAKLMKQLPNLAAHLRQRIVPWTGSVTTLFEGKLGFTAHSRGYIEAPDLPSRSTWFWTPDRDLVKGGSGAKVYYRYGGYELSYVGVDRPIATIPANSLVRVSLARWWKPDDADPTFPERCYLQLSGWYL